jgi:hypothetical protein
MAEESGMATTATLAPASEEEEEEAGEDVALATAAALPPSLFSAEDDARLEALKRVYADILGRWGLNQRRALLLKSCAVQRRAGANHGPGMSAICTACGASPVRGARCSACSAAALRCAVCGLPVRGLARGCVKCGHAGHFSHWTWWFREGKGSTCPAPSCGCDCKG